MHSLYQHQGEHFISVQTDMGTDVDMDIKVKSDIKGPSVLEISQSTSLSSI